MYDYFLAALICIITYLLAYRILEKLNLNEFINNRTSVILIFIGTSILLDIAVFLISNNLNISYTCKLLIQNLFSGASLALLVYVLPVKNTIHKF